MPSVFPASTSRAPVSLTPSSSHLGHRFASTYQEHSGPASNEHVSAMLHGRKSKSKGNQNARPSNVDLGQNSHSPHQRMTSAQQVPPGRQTIQQSAPTRGQKRKAQESLQSPARSRRRKNERHAAAQPRATMAIERLPTPKEHKDLPAKLFTEPKGVLHGLLQTVYKFTSEFSNPSPRSGGAFECKVTCSSVDGEDTRTTQGHGKNMVIECSSLLTYLLIECRELRRTLRSYAWRSV